MIKYFILNLFLLSILILFIFLFKVFFVNIFSKKFFILFIMFLIMVILNITCVVVLEFKKMLSCLVFLSFYSIFLIFFSFDQGVKVKVIILFKIFTDYFILILTGYFIFFYVNNVDFYNFLEFEYVFLFNFFFILIFMTYSLLGFFGFWIYWAMEASYFLSSYIHSCGFISLGLVLFFKLNFFGIFDNHFIFTSIINNISLFSYLFFIYLFLTIKDIKKSFGYFSASSICFLFFCSINYFVEGIIYFFTSSIIKILLFEVMACSKNKCSYGRFFIFIFLFILTFINFFLFFIQIQNLIYNFYVDLFIIFKSISIFLFLIRIFIISFTSNFFLKKEFKQTLFFNNFYFILFSFFIFIIIIIKFTNKSGYLVNSFISFGFFIFILFIFNFYFYFFFNTKFNYLNECLNYILIKYIYFLKELNYYFYYTFLKSKNFYINLFKKNIYFRICCYRNLIILLILIIYFIFFLFIL